MSARMCVIAALVAGGAIAPAPLSAQRARTCFVVVDSTGGVGRQIDVGRGFVRWYQGGGIWAHCRSEATRWASDSAAWFQDLDRFEMIDSVDFRDSTVRLTANRALYYIGDERLEAYGDARLENLKTGSVLTGPNLTYRRAVAGVRDTAEWFATRRPTIEYRAVGDSLEEPYVIVAERVRMLGESAASAWGRVTIDRSDFAARADSAELDTRRGEGRLLGNARVSGSDSSGFTLDGRVVNYRLHENALTWVQAEGGADATSDEWRIIGDTIQFDLVDGAVERGNVWGDSTQPRAVSAIQDISADSLAIAAPGQQLRTVLGIGRARAASRSDSTDPETDWLAGDTVVAHFDRSTTGGTTLVRLEAHGNARARYRVYSEDDPNGLPDLSYSRGERIVARFVADRLSRVDVVGRGDGIYLERRRRGS